MIYKQSIEIDNYPLGYFNKILDKFETKSLYRDINLSILLDSEEKILHSTILKIEGTIPLYVELKSDIDKTFDLALKDVAAVVEEMTIHYNSSILIKRIDLKLKPLTTTNGKILKELLEYGSDLRIVEKGWQSSDRKEIIGFTIVD